MATADADAPPLCVDLDGTLLRGDVGVETVLALLRRRPLDALRLPAWLARGLPFLKRQVALRTGIDAATLPYDERIIDWLRAQPSGRRRVLASASDITLVQPIADHLGLFDEVIATDNACNLAGSAKADELVRRFGEKGFDYAGNASADLGVWPHARHAIVVNASRRVARRAAAIATVERSFPPTGQRLRAWWRALRPHQWLKNLLVFVPILAAHRWGESGAAWQALLAFAAFGLCASGTYIANDLADLDADRRHPRKRARPFASGALPLHHGVAVAPLLVLAAFALAWTCLPRLFAVVVAAYLVLTLVYSYGLKRIAMLDVLVLAALYTLRLLAGGAAAGIAVSFWLLSFSMFLFLGLAMLKRYAELHDLRDRDGVTAAGRGYDVDDLPLVRTFGTAASLVSVLVLALYIDSTTGHALYRHTGRLWLLCPLLLYWLARAWLVAQRGLMHDDPVVYAARDRVSWLVLVIAAAILWTAL